MSENRRRMASPPPAMPTELVWGERDPSAEQYMNGDPESWAEGVRPGPYQNSQQPAMPTELAGHPASSTRAVLAKRAKKCITIAEAFLGRKASVESVEDHALSMMDWTDRQINAAYEKANEKLAGDTSYRAAAEKVEAEDGDGDKNPWETKSAAIELDRRSRMIMANAMEQAEIEDRKRTASILAMASEEKDACGSAPARMGNEDVGEEDSAEASAEVRAVTACLNYLSKMPDKQRFKRIAAFGKILKMADDSVAKLFSSEKLVMADTPMANQVNEHSQLLSLVQGGQLGQGFQTETDLDPMGELDGGITSGEFNDANMAVGGDEFSFDEAAEEADEFAEEADEFAEEADEEADEADLDAMDAELEDSEPEPEPMPKTASTRRAAPVQRPQPKKMSRVASPKRLGSVLGGPSENDVRRLSNLWSAPPDVSGHFGVTPTSMDIKDYE